MRHYKKGRKLGTDASHTKAMKKSLVGALFLNDRIKTVEARAKEVRGDVDKVIGWAKRGDVHARRLAIAYLGDKILVAEIFEKVAQGMFKDREGGYTRILKLGNRKGDNAPMVIMELVTEPVAGKKKADAKPAVKKAAGSKATPKKASKAEAEKAAAELEKPEGEVKEETEAAADAASDKKIAEETDEAKETTQAEGEKAEEAEEAKVVATEEKPEEASAKEAK